MAKIKVLHVIHSSKGGGAETQLDLLCRHALSAGIESVTFCVRSAHELNESERSYVRYERNRKFDFGLFGAVFKAIEEVRPDIVHAWLPPVVTIPALVAGWRAQVPVVTSLRNAKRLRRGLDVIEYALSWLLAEGLVSNTAIELCSPGYRKLFLRKSGVVIPNAVDVRRRYPVQDEKDGHNGAGLKIIFAGRIVKQKNVGSVIRALATPEARANWRLTICGEGPLEAELRRLVKARKLEDRVTWYGFRDDLREIMAGHDVIVLPSWYEGVPNVLLEAMAEGLPAVVSDIPSHRAILGKSGAALTFPPDDPMAMAYRLRRLAEDYRLRDELRERSKKVLAEYTIDALVARYSQYYASLIQRLEGSRAGSAS
jgi:glycosyltransferase involved in cell wall biosynthesis